MLFKVQVGYVITEFRVPEPLQPCRRRHPAGGSALEKRNVTAAARAGSGSVSCSGRKLLPAVEPASPYPGKSHRETGCNNAGNTRSSVLLLRNSMPFHFDLECTWPAFF